jgi:nucleoside-diphosphate-sugar epimerase
MKVFVTGSRGFIGKHLLLALKNRSIDVVPITFSNKAEEILTANGLIERRKKYVSPGDVLVHLSALGQRNQLNSDEEIYSHNFFKPRELLISMMNLGLKKVIITGSGAEYGETFMLRKPKPDDNLLPLDAYSRSKADLSVWISRYLQIPYSYFRLFQVYGSGATLPRLDATIENSFTSKKDIVLQFPKLKKDFISVCDVVELLV